MAAVTRSTAPRRRPGAPLLAELGGDGGGVDPGVLPRDLPLPQLEDVEQAEVDGTPAPRHAERRADGAGDDGRLVDDEPLAVVPAHRADLLEAKIGEQAPVEVPHLVLAGADGRGADHVVLDVERVVRDFLSDALDSDDRIALEYLHDALVDHLVATYSEESELGLSHAAQRALRDAGLLEDELGSATHHGATDEIDDLEWSPLTSVLDRYFDPGALGGIGFFSPAGSPEISSIVCDGWLYLIWDEGDGESVARRAFRLDAPAETRDRWDELVETFLAGDIDEDWTGPDEWWA